MKYGAFCNGMVCATLCSVQRYGLCNAVWIAAIWVRLQKKMLACGPAALDAQLDTETFCVVPVSHLAQGHLLMHDGKQM